MIPPGYLYAFLSSRFGVPLITSGTYGTIVQHIEREHIATIPVPRMPSAVEKEAHELVERAADLLDHHSSNMVLATSVLLEEAGVPDLPDEVWTEEQRHLGFRAGPISAETLRARHFDPRLADALHQIRSGPHSELATLCEPGSFKGKIIFKRIDADEEHGVMLLGQRNAFFLRPDGRWISRKSVEGLGLQVPAGTTLIPSHGTLGEYELFCRAIFVTDRMSNYAFSGDFFRCVPIHDRVHAGYLFAFLRSRLAFRLLRGISTGSKQQEQHPAFMARMPIPRLPDEREKEIASFVDEAGRALDEATTLEDRARTVVERAIEGSV